MARKLRGKQHSEEGTKCRYGAKTHPSHTVQPCSQVLSHRGPCAEDVIISGHSQISPTHSEGFLSERAVGTCLGYLTPRLVFLLSDAALSYINSVLLHGMGE